MKDLIIKIINHPLCPMWIEDFVIFLTAIS
nr:MAG TPA: hypothetical protein [Caudoviricetes sp.]